MLMHIILGIEVIVELGFKLFLKEDLVKDKNKILYLSLFPFHFRR